METCFNQYTFLQYDFISTLQFSYIGSSIRTLEGSIQQFKCKLLNGMWLWNDNCSHNPPHFAAFIIQVDVKHKATNCYLSASSVQKKPFFFCSHICNFYHHSAVQKVWKLKKKRINKYIFWTVSHSLVKGSLGGFGVHFGFVRSILNICIWNHLQANLMRWRKKKKGAVWLSADGCYCESYI